MGWAIGYDPKWQRDIGYSVPGSCDHPGCGAAIDRGLAHVCGGAPYGGEHGCGLFFCAKHLRYAGKRRENVQLCERCYRGSVAFEPTPDTPEWITHQLTHESWQKWRDENPDAVALLRATLEAP